MRFLILLVFYSCTSIETYKPTEIIGVSDPERSRDSYIADSRGGMVASAHPLASKIGADMLGMGGNAVDAAVATSFAIAVLRPQSSGIGGGGFLLHYERKKHFVNVIDYRERAPLLATRNMFITADRKPKPFVYNGEELPSASTTGHLASGVPGFVMGLVSLHKRQGKLPLAKLLAPSIRLAKEGFAVYHGLANALRMSGPLLGKFEESRRIFFRGDRVLQKGEKLVQADLGQTLELIAKYGVSGFYQGPVASAIVSEMQRGGGLISHADLQRYVPKVRVPVRGSYRGWTVFSMPPPSSGGVHIVQMLNMLEPYDIGSMDFSSAGYKHLLSEVMRRAFADRAKYLGDPDFVKVPVKGLLSKKYAANMMQSFQSNRASVSKNIRNGDPTAYESSSTAHVSVVDKHGNAVSTTHTVNTLFGSKVVVPGTGIVLNNEMDDFSIAPGVPNAFGLIGSAANAVAARKTMLSSMSPTLVFDPHQKLRLVVGSPGGPRIINATLQTIIHKVDFNMSLADAVHVGRIHHQWLPDYIRIEDKSLAPKVAEELRAYGHKIEVKGAIGDVQAIEVSGGRLIGVSDVRSDGKPAGFL